MDKRREEFEQWYESRYGDSRLIWLENVGEYDYSSVHGMWVAWQASRAALVVELPKPNVKMDVDIDDVRYALDKAGVKYE